MEIEHKVNQLKYDQVLQYKGNIEHLETHMSHVFLTDQHVYKLKKPILHDYLDFTTLEKRKRFCEIELSLNQRLASEIYLDIIPLISDKNRLKIGGEGETVDWMVKMKRISEHYILDNLLEKEKLPLESIKTTLERLSRFYADAKAEIHSAKEYKKRLRAGINDGIDIIVNSSFKIPKDPAQKMGEYLHNMLDNSPQLFEDRVKKGKIIEGHGDLRPEHLCTDPPLIFDALEFNREFRIVDPVDELSYLSMEAAKDGHPELEKLIFDTYSEITNDHFTGELLKFYKISRTLLRARLAVKRMMDIPSENEKKWTGKATTYLKTGVELIS